MKNKKLAIFGNSTMAEIVYFYFNKFSDYKIEFFITEKKFLKKKKLFGIKIISLDQFLKLNKKDYTVFVAIGYRELNKKRERFFNLFKKKNYTLTNFVHPDASIYTEHMGKNNFIMDNVSINPFSKIGNNNIFWSNSIIGHHNKIGNNNFFSGNSTISGNCKISNNCFFGVNSSTKDDIQVKNFCFVDANQYVAKALKNKTFYNLQINPRLSLNSFQIFDIK